MAQEEVTVKITVLVKLRAYEYDNPETTMNAFVEDTLYNFPSTDEVQCMSTEIIDCELN
tara:strand:- start:2515 stop:2691 length:177 start_codon:yes stop_codon:yes gene_type:complete